MWIANYQRVRLQKLHTVLITAMHGSPLAQKSKLIHFNQHNLAQVSPSWTRQKFNFDHCYPFHL